MACNKTISLTALVVLTFCGAIVADRADAGVSGKADMHGKARVGSGDTASVEADSSARLDVEVAGDGAASLVAGTGERLNAMADATATALDSVVDEQVTGSLDAALELELAGEIDAVIDQEIRDAIDAAIDSEVSSLVDSAIGG